VPNTNKVKEDVAFHRRRAAAMKREWFIYIVEEGDWPISRYHGTSREQARAEYLRWARRKRLPAGSVIWWRYSETRTTRRPR
jgi:hypothetical protein